MILSTTAQQIEEQITRELVPNALEVIDESHHHAGHAGVQEMQRHGTATQSGGTHFRIKIASPRFEGLNRVGKHRLVYASLQKFIDAGVHAIAIELL
jgi:BolA protein